MAQNPSGKVYAVKAGGIARDFGAIQWKLMNKKGWTEITEEEYKKIRSGQATGATFTPPEVAALKGKNEPAADPAPAADKKAVVKDLSAVNETGAGKGKTGKSAPAKGKAAGKTAKGK